MCDPAADDALKELKGMSLEKLWQLFPIVLKEHNPDYAHWYDEEKQALLQVLHNFHVCRINHIGSSSVTGLIAKPIVDILIELPRGYAIDDVAAVLESNGWIQMARDDSQGTLDLNKGYTPAGFAEKVWHLHIKSSGDWDELYFRDYLQEHPDVARQYETLKLFLQKKYEHNRDAYTKAKTEFVMEHSQKARDEYKGRYVPTLPYKAKDW